MAALSEERWRAASPYLDEALDLAEPERSAWLAALRTSNPTLATDILTLIAAHDALGDEHFLELDAGELAGTLPFAVGGDARSTAIDGAGVADRAGASFGQYRLVEPLGEGGMGVVWLAEQQQPIRRTVAVKVVKPGCDSAQVLSRFESERQALAILNHPHIAKVFDAGVTADGRPYFVMEHVDGEPIAAFADARTLSIDDRIQLFLQVCEAVQHAHQKGVLHRDLKPRNILVGEQDGRPVAKVIDFGIAKAVGPPLTGQTQATQHGALVGTPAYMSPEQAGLVDASVDTRTDIYSLGVVLYELLIGRLPFDFDERARGSVFELLRTIRDAEPPALATRLKRLTADEREGIARSRSTTSRTLERRLAGDLEWITARAIEKEPARRYASASELAADLRRHLASEPVLAGPPDMWYRLGKLSKKHRAAAIATVVTLVASIAAAIVSSVFWMRADRTERENRKGLQTLHVTTGLQLASEADDLKALPWLVRALELEDGDASAPFDVAQGNQNVHRIRMGHLVRNNPYPVRIWKHDGLVGARLSSDRTALATWNDRGEVLVWDPARGEPLGPAIGVPDGVVDLAIAGAGTVVVTADARGNVRVWNSRKGAEPTRALAHGPGLRLVRVTSDGSRVLSADLEGNVRVWAADTGSELANVQHGTAVTVATFLGEGRSVAVGGETGSATIAPTDGGRTLRLPVTKGLSDIRSFDDRRLATTTSMGMLQLWDRRTGQQDRDATRLIPNGVRSVDISQDGTVALMCGIDGAVLVVPGASSTPKTLDPNRMCATAALSSDGLLAATGSTDGTARVWTLQTSRPFTSRLPHGSGIHTIAFLSDSRHVLSVDTAGVVRVWDIASVAPRPGIFAGGYTWTSAFSPDGRRLALASGTAASSFNTGTANVIDLSTWEGVTPPLRHGDNVRAVAFSADGERVATGASDGTARIWNVSTGEPLSDELRHGFGLRRVTFSADGQRLLTLGLMSDTQRVPAGLWEVATGRRIASLCEACIVEHAEFSPDGRHVLTIDADRHIRIWQAIDGRPVRDADWAPYTTASFLSNAHVLAVGARSIDVRGLDGSTISSQSHSIDGVFGTIVNRQGSRFAAFTPNGTLPVWRTAAPMAPLFAPPRLPGYIMAAAFSDDGRWLAGATGERRAQVWSMASGEAVTPRITVPALPLSASFSPDGTRFQISGVDALVGDLLPEPSSRDRLKKLSQLLSGHDLVGTELVPVTAERLIELARDRDLLNGIEPIDDANWRRLVANHHASRAEWAAVDALLAPAAGRTPPRWEDHAMRGRALGEMGRWEEAERAFNAALIRRPDWTELHFYVALTRFARGEGAALDAGCRTAWERFGPIGNPDRAYWLSRLCALAASPHPDAASWMLERARGIQDPGTQLEPHLITFARVLIEAREYPKAIAMLNDVWQRPDRATYFPETQLLLAIAEERQGHHGKATAAFARFREGAARFKLPWHRRLETDRWLR